MTNEPVCETETDLQTEQTCGYHGGGTGGRDGLGGWDSQMQTVTERMDKQGPTVQHRELESIS